MSRYGSRFEDILRCLAENHLFQDNISDTPYYKGEVIYAIRQEMAVTLEDFLRRRTSILLDKGPNHTCVNEVASLFQQELAWTDTQKESEIHAFLESVSKPLYTKQHNG